MEHSPIKWARGTPPAKVQWPLTLVAPLSPPPSARVSARSALSSRMLSRNFDPSCHGLTSSVELRNSFPLPPSRDQTFCLNLPESPSSLQKSPADPFSRLTATVLQFFFCFVFFGVLEKSRDTIFSRSCKTPWLPQHTTSAQSHLSDARAPTSRLAQRAMDAMSLI